MMTFLQQYPYFVVALTSLLVNIPCGYLRAKAQKFSLGWFFWIHASIPVIISARITLGTSKWFIPVVIFLAVLGQIIGSRWRLSQMTELDKERFNQINDLKLAAPRLDPVHDRDVMVVLMNMGGPKTNAGVKDFLYRLFLDPYILRFPLSQILQPFFAWLIVTIRLKATQERYQLIGGGSPIFASTEQQARALKAELQRRGRSINVTFSFNYSEPLPETTMQEIKAGGHTAILPLSLYPHHSLATTGSNMYYLEKASEQIIPNLKYLECPSYYLHNGYIAGFKDRIMEQLKEGESLSDFYILFSTHGLPLYFLIEGDPYPFQISQTVARVLQTLDRTQNWSISYQSAVGPLQWLKPSTEDVLHSLAIRGITKILVVPISFVTDHIETTCEINMEYRHVAKELGITDFRMSKALECHPGFIQTLADTVELALPKASKIDTKFMHNSVQINQMPFENNIV